MKFFRVIFSLCLVLGLVSVLAAQGVPGPRRIIVTLRGNAVIVGNLIRLDPDKLEMVGENSIRIIDVDDIVSITFDQGQGNSAKASHNNGVEGMLVTKDTPPPAQEKGTPQTIPPDPAHLPRGYGKTHDRPSRRGAREASRKLEEAKGETPEAAGETQNVTGNPVSNNNNPGNNGAENPVVVDEEARAAAERAETERLARVRTERLAREKANRERAARERVAREKRELAAKAEKERKERAERAEREKKEKAEKNARKEKDAKNAKTKNNREDAKADTKVKGKAAKEKKPEIRKKGKK